MFRLGFAPTFTEECWGKIRWQQRYYTAKLKRKRGKSPGVDNIERI